ncbi:MAG: hypothetical protein AAFP70_16105, partial [Calditrichota bacterium]
MKKLVPGILSFILLLLAVGCSNNPELRSEHPLETNLIPHVQIASAPKTFSIEERMREHRIPGFSLGVIENNQLVF